MPSNTKNKERLIELGFREIGYWSKDNDSIEYVISNCEDLKHKKVLYAFIIEDDIKYIGKTARKIKSRLDNYKNSDSSQSTNTKCREKILDSAPNSVKIWLYIPMKLQTLGFNINLAAGLEDSLIKQLEPEWNHLGKSKKLNKNRTK
jgi:hypothetical protein